MLKIISKFIIFFIILLHSNVFALETNWSSGIESKLRLISPISHNNNQNEFYIGLEYKLEKNWKTYWQSAGEGGFPQEINWDLSENVEDLKILWPIPQYFEILGFNTIGYVDDVIFPLKINIRDISKKTIINLDISYLTCKDICIPGKAQLRLLIPPGIGQFTSHNYNLQKELSLIPKSNFKFADFRNFTTNAYEDNNNISIVFSAESKNVFNKPTLFLHSEFGLPIEKPKISYSPNLKKIKAKFEFDKNNISKDNFILNIVYSDNNKNIEFVSDVKVEKFSNISILNNSLVYILIISLIGGIILNVMPCVLPVISIKILSVLQQPKNKISIRTSFFITSLGIISSFIILAFALVSLRFLGVSIGWGMQFQQPIFLFIIAIILFIFSINLFGLFEFRTPSFVNLKFLNKSSNLSYSKDFFNGFFATILATPCSAPFVGTAITAAFTQSVYTMIGIFFFMGVGMASPYLLISLFPNITNFLPKPGNWMKKIRYFLGILLLGTFFWIFSILISHFNFLTYNIDNNKSDWLDITKVDLEELKQKNSIVFVDITADWCATCKFNKINVIDSKVIREKFKDLKVVKVRGDWTKPNKKIENYLQSYNRYGVPFNVIYNHNPPYEYVLSELLSKDEILNYLNR